MKKSFNYILKGMLLVTVLAFSSCEIEEIVDPNNPSVGSAISNASFAEMQFLITGLESRHRSYFGNAAQMFGSFGREVWPYFASDPRFIGDWLDMGGDGTYSDFFGSGGTYATPYLAVKQANIVIQAAENSTKISAQQVSAAKGIAKTIKGYQLLWPLMQQWNNGIRIEVEDPLNPGPRVGIDNPTEALQAIQGILNEGLSDLQAAGGTLGFKLSVGFSGFDTPAGFAQVNRAIAARVALYAKDYAGALNALNGSFIDLNVDATSTAKMQRGPAHVYGQPPDGENPLFQPFDRPTAAILICHPAWIEDALPNDARLNKVRQLVTNKITNSGLRNANGELLVGEYQDVRWSDNGADIPFIRNEELILIYAEAQLFSNNTTEAVRAINIVRNTWGVGNYDAAGKSQDDILEEILFQRRYSLWNEGGHRWIDLRRTGKLDAAHVDLRDQGHLILQVARPSTEINWDGN
jgi:starch-binding outer membrane protein, SusD/RagB family